jgi:hypothetical protein
MTATDKKIAQAKKELHAIMSTKSLEELKIQFEIAVHTADLAMMAITGKYIKEWMGENAFTIYIDNVKATI